MSSELDTTRESEFLWRRLGEAFPLSGGDESAVALLGVVGGLFLLAVAAFVGTIIRKGRSESIVFWVLASTRAAILLLPAALLLVGKYGKLPQPKPLWQTLAVGTCLLAIVLTVLSYLRDSRNHFGWWTLAFLGWLAAGAAVAIGPVLLVLTEQPITLTKAGFADALPAWMWLGVIAWWTVPALILLFGAVVATTGKVREPHTVGLFWTPLLAQIRTLVYVVLAVAFMLPAMQEKDRTKKQSRVLVILDVSPSVADTSDDVAKGGGKGKTRLDKILDFLTDEKAVATDGSDKVNLLKNLLNTNAVYAFRFGRQLDDDAQVFPLKSAPWTRDEWAAWVKYDFRPVALRGLSDDGRAKATTAAAWKAGEFGNAEWAMAWARGPEADAIPSTLSAEDKAALIANRTKMITRVEMARSVVTGTDVPGSLTDLIKRESANLVRGIVVFSDGRSNPGAAGSVSALRELVAKEKIPIFTVAVGAIRDNVAIDITDLQAPSATGPDEPIKVTVSADAIGLPGYKTDVLLDLYLPGQDAKKDTPAHTITKQIEFKPGDPPRGEVEFLLDPDDKLIPEVLTEKSTKEGRGRQFKSSVGPQNWKLVARIKADQREIFDGEYHVTPPREMLIQDRILRVLLVASAPSREYQTLRTLLVREENQGRARVCVLIQNEAGLKGDIVQDVEPNQILTRFPDRLDLTNKVRSDDPADRFYNLNEYDLVMLFDPDWEEKSTDGVPRISEQSIKNLATWVDNLGGGLIYVAAPLYTNKLARTDEKSVLRPLVDVLPVEPLDSVVVRPKDAAPPREARRLLLTPSPLANLLRLEEDILKDNTDQQYQVAGWEKFFTGKERFDPAEPDRTKYMPTRGMFSYHPVKPKRGATVLARFADLDANNQPRRGSDGEIGIPYLAITQPARGRSAFLGSGEIYRIRQTDTAYYDRFWIKMCRFLVANREAKASRGRVLISKEYTSGSVIRVQARILGPNAKPYPADGSSSINPTFRVEQLKASGEFVKAVGTYPLVARKGSVEFEGYYMGQAVADPKLFSPDDFLYRVVVDVPDGGEPLVDTFRIRRSDPELDNLRPDFEAMRAMASSLEEVKSVANLPIDQKTLAALRGTAETDAKAKMSFNLSDTEKLKLIPNCITPDSRTTVLRGKVDDLWDNEMEPPATAEANIEFFRSNLFGTGRFGRWGTLFGILCGVLLIGAGVGAVWLEPLKYAAYLLAVAGVAFAYLGNPFPLGTLTEPVWQLLSAKDIVAPLQAEAASKWTVLYPLIALDALLSLYIFVAAPILAAALRTWAPVNVAIVAFVGRWIAGLLFGWPIFVLAANPDLTTVPWGMLLGVFLAIASVGFGIAAIWVGWMKWAAVVSLALGALAVTPVLFFATADAKPPAPAASWDITLRWGTLIALPLGILSTACFLLSGAVGGFKWVGLALLIAAGTAVYLAYPFPVGIVIAVCVSLLSFEWMTRKLLRMA